MARSTPAVRYAAEMLEFLADDPRSEYTLSEIARAIGHNKASCSGILHTMEQSGLVSRHPIRKRYSVGPALIRLGAAANERYRVIGVASAEVTKLAKELGVEWNISAPIGGSIVELAASYHRVPLFGLDVGQKVPFVAPVGAVYIAWSSDEEIDEWIQRADSGPPDDAQRERHRQSAQAIRIRGYSVGIQSDVYAKILDAVSSTTRDADGGDGSEEVLGILRGTSSDDYSLIEFARPGPAPRRLHRRPGVRCGAPCDRGPHVARFRSTPFGRRHRCHRSAAPAERGCRLRRVDGIDR